MRFPDSWSLGLQVSVSAFFQAKAAKLHSAQEHAKTLQEEELDFVECCGDYSFEAMLDACEASVEGLGFGIYNPYTHSMYIHIYIYAQCLDIILIGFIVRLYFMRVSSRTAECRWILSQTKASALRFRDCEINFVFNVLPWYHLSFFVAEPCSWLEFMPGEGGLFHWLQSNRWVCSREFRALLRKQDSGETVYGGDSG